MGRTLYRYTHAAHDTHTAARIVHTPATPLALWLTAHRSTIDVRAGIDHIVSQVTEKMLYTNNGLYIHTRLKGQGNGLRFLSFVQYCSP